MRAMNDEDRYDIPMTPMIDVVFQLLIFFLVATTFVRVETDHAVRLPESEAGVKAASVPDRLVINIREDATLVVNGRIATETELRGMAAEFAGAHPERSAVIRADGRVVYQAVMRIFGICRASGVKFVDLPVMEPEKR
ncbi:MAG: biopolymer transporter ExbD [Planctomycetota bacterium]|jgi:biopolymer transport protein ExbD|nr:biopolymer transporter ExbD [Planctomycetota bacterium]